jgi:predicted RNA-binding protein with PUA-like domain
MTKYWLMKTEPNVFSYTDLTRAPGATSSWDGVRNYQCRNFMRDDFRVGDGVLIYHSSVDVPGVAGIAQVVREAYPDITALNPDSEYFDPKSAELKQSRWVMVDVQARAALKTPVTLQQMREVSALADMLVLRKGMRLSIQPVTPKEWATICKLGGIDAGDFNQPRSVGGHKSQEFSAVH